MPNEISWEQYDAALDNLAALNWELVRLKLPMPDLFGYAKAYTEEVGWARVFEQMHRLHGA